MRKSAAIAIALLVTLIVPSLTGCGTQHAASPAGVHRSAAQIKEVSTSKLSGRPHGRACLITNAQAAKVMRAAEVFTEVGLPDTDLNGRVDDCFYRNFSVTRIASGETPQTKDGTGLIVNDTIVKPVTIRIMYQCRLDGAKPEFTIIGAGDLVKSIPVGERGCAAGLILYVNAWTNPSAVQAADTVSRMIQDNGPNNS